MFQFIFFGNYSPSCFGGAMFKLLTLPLRTILFPVMGLVSSLFKDYTFLFTVFNKSFLAA
jgi:hypothetical protein